MRFRDSASRKEGRQLRSTSGHAVKPRKSLGQNFLQDETLAKWIVDQLNPDGVPLVIEAGPGLRALTQHLQGRPAKLLLVEKDRNLAASLAQHYGDEPSVEVMEADATQFDLRPCFAYGDVRFIGNLPYSVGGEILKHVLTPPTPIQQAVFMLQKEVCDRLATPCGKPGCSALSALVQRDWVVELLQVVPPEVFVPKPKVDSAVVRVTPRPPESLKVCDRRRFEQWVRQGFSQRRKQLKNLLTEAPLPWAECAASLGVLETVRAEELTLEQWVELTRLFEGRSGPDAGQGADEVFDLVNEFDEVVGQAVRSAVHRQGLRHRAVHVFVFNRRGELFLQQRSHLKDVAPLAWDSSAAGHLDAGESYAEAARRELREELGIDVSETKKRLKIEAGPGTDNEFVELHSVRYDGKVRWPAEEVRTGQWFHPELISQWVKMRPEDFARGFVSCWHHFLELPSDGEQD